MRWYWVIHWVRRLENRVVNQWLTDIYFDMPDGHQHVLTAGPKVDVNLEQVLSSSEIAQRYLKLSPLFVLTNAGELIARAQIKRIQQLNRLEATTWSRYVWFGFFCTRWRRKIDKPVKIC